MDNFTKAKAALFLDHPFFASLFSSMAVVEDPATKTMSTDGKTLRFNPEFVKSKSVSELVFVLAHETMHNALMHLTRRGDRGPNRWNQAADYVINDVLVREGVGIMPEGCLHDSNLVAQGNGTAEGVYGLLPEEDEQKQAGDMPGGGSMDEMKDEDIDQAEKEARESEARVDIVRAAGAAKGVGKLSADMERMVKELTRSRVDWKSVLRRFFTERAKVDLSFAKPKRRFLGEDIYLPGLVGEQLGEVVFAVDCSGSIDDQMLALFGGEAKAIVEDTKPRKVHVIYFDSKVCHHDQYEVDQTVEFNSHGGGGTRFSPVFDYIEENNINPVACVFLTDLDCYDFGEDPGYPVLWATTEKEEAPFGEVLRIKE